MDFESDFARILGGFESTSAADEFLAQRATSSRASQYVFVGTIKKRSAACSKSSWTVRGSLAVDTSWVVNSSRAHERLAKAASTISGVLEKMMACRNPSRCRMRSKRSSKLMPHNSVSAPGASAIKIGRMFSIPLRLTMSSRHANFERHFGLRPTVRLLSARGSGNRAARETSLAGDDAAVFHFVDPIARFGNRRIVRGQ